MTKKFAILTKSGSWYPIVIEGWPKKKMTIEMPEGETVVKCISDKGGVGQASLDPEGESISEKNLKKDNIIIFELRGHYGHTSRIKEVYRQA
jgi:hypothetical protein